MHTFDICIDESGDEGFNFENSDTTRWFVLAGAVVIRHNMDTLQSSLRELKASIGWKDKKPLHFRDLKPPNRERMVNQLVQVGPHVFRGLAILVHKPSLLEPEIFQQKSRLYFYFARYLLERASWVCRDARISKLPKFGNGKGRVVFSHRTDLRYEDFQDYLAQLRSQQTTIAWDSIDTDTIVTLSNGKHPGLQVADALASAFYCANHHRPDLCDHKWCETLKPVMYTHQNRHRGYGVKIFPAEAEKQIAQGNLAPWANLHYR